uniref:E3 ubiquitin protein ligase n=1 Tax=Globisporangium ultimum (strain ATCC 200006 / CBS 805.95 / DAOM BR144) TaxID=431595 RepID=K3WQG6_GLOUD
MADTQQNGKRSMAAAATSAESTPALKKMKLEQETPPEANPNTMEAVKEKNKAMELDLREKNRRIVYLAEKCEALYRHRAMLDTSFRCVRRQWFQLHDDLRSSLQILDNAAQSEWADVLSAVERFGLLQMRPKDLTIALPEWFLAITKADAEEAQLPSTDDHENEDENDAAAFIAKDDLTNMEKELHEQLIQKQEETNQLVGKILAAIVKNQSITTTIEYKQILQDKRAAVAEALALKEQVQACETRIQELEKDVQVKEVERHRACRDFDRLSKFVERNSASLVDPALEKERLQINGVAADKKSDVQGEKTENVRQVSSEEQVQKDKETAKMIATLKENHVILSAKLYQERAITAELKKDVERLQALEAAWKKDEATLTQEYEDKLEQLREEKNHIAEEFAKIRHKAKDIETHVNDKWKKKVARIQADMTKVKTQMDELNLKNVSFREKLSNASALREQLAELKSQHEILKSENGTLKAQLDRVKQKSDRAEKTTKSKEIHALTEKVVALEKSKLELQRSYAAVVHSELEKGDDKLSSLIKRQAELDAQLNEELQAHSAMKTRVENLQLEIDDLKAGEAASREENDALISEIDSISKEMESMRQSRKKLVQQLEEKRNSYKKLHTQLSKEEQAKAHCFEELAAARLQVSTLGTIHKNQKTYIESVKESLQAKEAELEQLKEYVKNVETEKNAADSEKRKVLREAEVAKQIYTTSAAETSQKQQQLLQEKRRACEKCETYRKKEERYEKLLQAAKATPATGELNDLERFELKELQKLVNCSVCQDQRKNVLISKCFHMFCKDCIDSNLKSRNRKCPTCKKMFGQDDVKSVWFT